MSRRGRFGVAAAAFAGGAAAYGLYRLGARYRPDAPLAGLTDFRARVRSGMAERERDLRDALGYDATGVAPKLAGDGRAPAYPSSPQVDSARLSAEEARDLLRDPAGPRPDRVAGDEGAGI